MNYSIQQAPVPSWNEQSNYFTGGQFMVKGDTIIFQGGESCSGTGVYRFAVNGKVISFTMIDDMCDERKKVLAGFSFNMMEDIQIYDRSGCPGDPVEFSIAGGKTYEWHFGDNSPVSTAQKVLHAYADTGTYKAFVIATNACGRKDTIPSIVKIGRYNKPFAYFDMDKQWAKKGDTIRFFYHGDDRGHDVNKYSWDFGDGNTSTIREAKHIYQYRGGYKIRLTVTNGCGSNTNERYIEIGDPFDQCNLSAKFSIEKADTAKLYPDKPVKFIDNTFGAYTNRTWNFGDGVVDTSANPMHTYLKAGIYKVCLSVKDVITGCSDMACMEVVVGSILCKADYSFVVNNTTNAVSFNDASINANKWYWDFNDGNNSYSGNPVHQFVSPGVYNICLVTFDTISKCQSKRCDVITVGQIDTSKYCKAEFSFFVNHTTNEVSFKNQSIGKIQKGYWNFGDGLFDYEENPIHKFTKPGVYQVCANIVDSSGCQSSVCKEIQVGVVNCKSDFTYFVDPDLNKVSFTDNSLGKNLKTFWNFGDGAYSNSLNPGYQYRQPGVYKVCHFIKDTVSGCVSENCLEITIGEVKCNVDYSFIIDPSSRQVRFKGITNAASLKWNWDFGDGYSDTTEMPVRSYQRDGFYNVCLRVYDPVNKCVADRCKLISIGAVSTIAAIDADFSFNLEPKMLKAQFNDKSVGNPNKYHWNFGDGKFSDLQNPEHIYIKPGVYKVCQTVGDTITGKISQECREIYLAENACRADFSFFVNPDSKTVKFCRSFHSWY
ncbi:MAG: PKD domain-containing protein [Bacteroidales bacterium]|nr:PKD domain-containing protein [Bacteroidales bacterium]